MTLAAVENLVLASSAGSSIWETKPPRPDPIRNEIATFVLTLTETVDSETTLRKATEEDKKEVV